MIRDEVFCGEKKSCDRRRVKIIEPFFDESSLIRDPILSHDRISHQLMGNGAVPLVRKVIVLFLHDKINLIFNTILLIWQIL
jgi:hypothetical protein